MSLYAYVLMELRYKNTFDGKMRLADFLISQSFQRLANVCIIHHGVMNEGTSLSSDFIPHLVTKVYVFQARLVNINDFKSPKYQTHPDVT